MKKVIVLLAVLVMSALMLVGCGSPVSANSNDQGDGAAAIIGETYEAGNLSALVPDGWKAFPASDLFDEYDGDYDPNGLSIYKGAEDEFDVLIKPGMQITYYDGSMMEPSKDFYDDAEDLEPFELGGYTWQGFTCTSLDYPIAVLWAEDGNDQFSVNVWLENEGEQISLEDADVQAIIESIQSTE